MSATISVHKMDDIILRTKEKIRRWFTSLDEIIKELGTAFESETDNPSTICVRIKNALKEEIDDKLITPRQIERCCPEKWKKHTKPSGRRINDILSFSKPSIPGIQESAKALPILHHNDSDTIIHDIPTTTEKAQLHTVSYYYTVPKEKFAELMTALRNSKEHCRLTFDPNRYLMSILVG